MIDLLIWLIAVVSAVGGLALGKYWGRADGMRASKKEADRDAMEKRVEHVKEGRRAVHDGRNVGSPADRLHRNDRRW